MSNDTSGVQGIFLDLQNYASLTADERAQKVKKILEKVQEAVVDQDMRDRRPHEREYPKD